MRIDVLTLFPEVFAGYLSASILGRAIAAGRLEAITHNIRDHATNKHKKVDDRPFGGGPGMVMMCQPIVDATDAVEAMASEPTVRLAMTPAGEPLSQPLVEELAAQPRLMLLAGHYEGIDQRALELGNFREVSIGDYVLTGGELPAMVVIDAVARQLPSVIGDERGPVEESFSNAFAGLLEPPQYTRPRDFRGEAVPEVLLNGNHAEIDAWKRQQSETRTRQRRPDLLG